MTDDNNKTANTQDSQPAASGSAPPPNNASANTAQNTPDTLAEAGGAQNTNNASTTNDVGDAPQQANTVINDIADKLQQEGHHQNVVAAKDIIEVEVSAVLGRTRMKISELLEIGRGAVIELERKVDDPVRLYVKDKPVASAHVVVDEDSRLSLFVEKLYRHDI